MEEGTLGASVQEDMLTAVYTLEVVRIKVKLQQSERNCIRSLFAGICNGEISSDMARVQQSAQVMIRGQRTDRICIHMIVQLQRKIAMEFMSLPSI